MSSMQQGFKLVNTDMPAPRANCPPPPFPSARPRSGPQHHRHPGERPRPGALRTDCAGERPGAHRGARGGWDPGQLLMVGGWQGRLLCMYATPHTYIEHSGIAAANGARQLMGCCGSSGGWSCTQQQLREPMLM
jgi:hypothetical protein